jgi:hypothetical protein
MRSKWNDGTIVHDILRRRFFVDREVAQYGEGVAGIVEQSQIIVANSVVPHMIENNLLAGTIDLSDIPDPTPVFDFSLVFFNGFPVNPNLIKDDTIGQVGVQIIYEKIDDHDDLSGISSCYIFLRSIDGKRTQLENEGYNIFHSKSGAINTCEVVDLPSMRLLGEFPGLLPKGSFRLIHFVLVSFYTMSVIRSRRRPFLDTSKEYTPVYGKKFRSKKLPELSWRTIFIDPSSSPQFHPSIKSGDVRNLPLHIVCGHSKSFKNFFGRGPRTVKVSPFWRGDKDNGIVIKDYEVRPWKS